MFNVATRQIRPSPQVTRSQTWPCHRRSQIRPRQIRHIRQNSQIRPHHTRQLQHSSLRSAKGSCSIGCCIQCRCPLTCWSTSRAGTHSSPRLIWLLGWMLSTQAARSMCCGPLQCRAMPLNVPGHSSCGVFFPIPFYCARPVVLRCVLSSCCLLPHRLGISLSIVPALFGTLSCGALISRPRLMS